MPNSEFQKWQKINTNRININKGEEKNLRLDLETLPYKLYPIKKEEINNVKVNINALKYLEAPVSEKSKIGEVKVQLGEKELCNINIITKNSVARKSVLNYILELLGKYKVESLN